MSRNHHAFATLLVLTILMPLSILVFHFWHTASIYYELTIQRQKCHEEVRQLEAVLAVVVKQLKKDHVIIWGQLGRLAQPLVLPLVLSQDSKTESAHFRALIDKPLLLDEQQVRICIQLLVQQERVKRSLTCLLNREQMRQKEKEGYVFTVDYFTLGNSF